VELDYENVMKYQIGLRTMEMPMTYRTGEAPGSKTTLALAWAPEHARMAAERTADQTLRWLISPWANDGDYIRALLGLLLLRRKHLWSEYPLGWFLPSLVGAPDRRALLARLEQAALDIGRLSAELSKDIASALAEPSEPTNQPG
jgi:hypothetical protein